MILEMIPSPKKIEAMHEVKLKFKDLLTNTCLVSTLNRYQSSKPVNVSWDFNSHEGQLYFY